MTLGPKRKKHESASDADFIQPLKGSAIVREAKEFLTTMGLRLPRRPKDKHGRPLDPVFPSDLSITTSDELGRLHSEFTAMATYAFGRLAVIDTVQEIAAYNEKLERTENYLRGNGPVKDREAQGLTNETSVDRAYVYYVKNAKYRLLRVVAEGFERKAKALSREITRRQGDLGKE